MNILICGVGAIGSNLVKNLVPDLKGEHEITVLDMDNVEERNITPGTQFYSPDQIGLPKVEALQMNIYKWYEREIDVIHGELGKDVFPKSYEKMDLIVDCFDNYDARYNVQQIFTATKGNILHIGFSDKFTFAIEWAHNYQVPTDITTGMDICEMEGASAFVAHVGALASLVVEEFVNKEEKMEILGGKFYAKKI